MSSTHVLNREFFTVKQVAGILTVSKRTIYRRIEEDKNIYAVKVAGRSIRIPREEVKKLIKDTNE